MRSQSLWHGIASAMGPDDPVTLSFCQPLEPYVCIGFHRDLSEIDQESCRKRGWPVIRRQIGGGPVFIDSDQLFFQITIPVGRAPVRVDHMYRRLLGPAVEAFRSLGIDARLKGVNEIATGDRRLSGTGAGRIGDAVTVVGNVIFRFDPNRMGEVLALPSESMRSEYVHLMRRHLASLYDDHLATASVTEVKSAWTEAYRTAFAGEIVYGQPTTDEESEIAAWEDRFCQPRWLAGASLSGRPGRQVKVWAGAWLFENSQAGMTVRASIVGGSLRRVSVISQQLNGISQAMSSALLGQAADRKTVSKSLALFGADGRRIAELLAPGLELR